MPATNRIAQLNSTSQRVHIFIQDATTFSGFTGLAFDTAGFTIYYSLGPSDSFHAITLVTQTVGGAWTSGGFVEIDATHAPGWYQLDIPDAVFASGSGNSAQVVWKKTGIEDGGIYFDLVNYDPFNVDKSGFSLSNAGIQAFWNIIASIFTVDGSIGKILNDNVPIIKTEVDAIKAKTDPITLVSGGVELHAHGMDKVIGYHPAGDA